MVSFNYFLSYLCRPRNSVVNSISATGRRLSSVEVLPEINSNMKTQSGELVARA